MVLYVILMFVAILVGMAVSVFAFGTGGKRSRVFQDIYFTVEEVDGIGILYTKNGDYSAVLEMENPVLKYSANIDAYYGFTSLLNSLTQTLGEGYALHKQDIFCRRRFHHDGKGSGEFLRDHAGEPGQQALLLRCPQVAGLHGEGRQGARPAA